MGKGKSVRPTRSKDRPGTLGIPGQSQETTSTQPVNSNGLMQRREFLIRSASLAFSAATLTALLDACSGTDSSPPASVPAEQNVTPTNELPPAPPQIPIITPPPAPAQTPAPKPAFELTERQKISHLLRRAGFGATKQDLDRFTALGIQATVDYLVDFEKTDNSKLENRLIKINLDLDTLVDLQRWWYLRMIYTERPLQEKMVLFWHGLLTSGFSKVGRGPYMHNQNSMFRKLCMGDFGTLLKAIARDPAMLIWLDSQVNVKAAPNENFARELMELFSMGIGNYTEEDVRESSRAFTGWLLVNKAFKFNASQHDVGNKTFLGATGNFDGDDIIDIILQQEVTGEFISRKLFAFFAYDDPPDETIASLAKVFRDSGNQIKEVVRQILLSPEFYSEKAYRAKIKGPAELIASTIRILGMETDGAGLTSYGDRMGQSLFDPFDVSGWLQGGVTWINSNSLIQRLNFANSVATARNSSFKYNPVEIAQLLNITSPVNMINYYADLLVDGNIPVETRSILAAFSRFVDIPGGLAALPPAVVDEKLRSLVYLVMSMPEYQLA